jgi:hypothetical protein
MFLLEVTDSNVRLCRGACGNIRECEACRFLECLQTGLFNRLVIAGQVVAERCVSLSFSGEQDNHRYDIPLSVEEKQGFAHIITGFLDLFHRPVFQRTENTTFRKMDLFPSSDEGGEDTYSVGSLRKS